MDEQLPLAAIESLQILFIMTGILIMNFVVTPWMIIPTIILGAVVYFIGRVYLASAQDVKRLEGVSKSK